MTTFRRAHTKIVATLGPASRSEAQLASLIDVGADVFRLNMAHGTLEEHEAVLKTIRRLSAARSSPVGVLVDLAGPKIRLGTLAADPLDCQVGSEVRFVRGLVATGPNELVTTYDALIDELRPGDRVMLVDGTVRLEVVDVTPEHARCCVVQGGLVRSRQGVNLPGAHIALAALSDEDREHARWAARVGADFVGLSFVRSPTEVHQLKALLAEQGSSAKVIAKIEKQEALDSLEAVVAASDGVMVARGDLGVEIDVAGMPVVQKRIVAVARRLHRPVIIATQMLDSMQRSRLPTRAETTDVANAILDGCDACMLSGETAVGQYPREAVEMMHRIALATEPLLEQQAAAQETPGSIATINPVTEAMVYGAERVARQLRAKLVVVVSSSGATALALSGRRLPMTIVGCSDRPETLRQMALTWGVVPLTGAPHDDSRHVLEFVEQWGRRDGMLQKGDYMVMAAGRGLASAGHNMVRVHEVKGG